MPAVYSALESWGHLPCLGEIFIHMVRIVFIKHRETEQSSLTMKHLPGEVSTCHTIWFVTLLVFAMVWALATVDDRKRVQTIAKIEMEIKSQNTCFTPSAMETNQTRFLLITFCV